MPLTVNIPDEVVRAFPSGVVPTRHVLQSVVLELYREQAISGGKVAELLNLSRLEADRLLARHDLLASPTRAECARDSEVLAQMLEQ